MKYAIEVGSGFIKIASAFQKLMGGTHTQHGGHTSLLSFCQNKEIMLKYCKIWLSECKNMLLNDTYLCN
jgi:hypothetical protein